jgi:acyl-CoA thioesterase I
MPAHRAAPPGAALTPGADLTRLLRLFVALAVAVACLAVLVSCDGAPAAGSALRPTPTPTATTAPGPPRLVYAALGASETYGVGAPSISGGYAYLVRDDLHVAAPDFADVAIPAATLGDAFQTELTNALAIRPNLCTVFFGVNDIRAGVPLAQFRSDLGDLVTTLVRARCRVLVIGVPDVSALPAVRTSGLGDLAGVSRSWNAAIRAVAVAAGAAFLDLGALSAELAAHPEDIAPDGLHPSAAGHARLAALVIAALQSRGYTTP